MSSADRERRDRALASSVKEKFGEEVRNWTLIHCCHLPTTCSLTFQKRPPLTTAAWVRRTCCSCRASPSSSYRRSTPSRPRSARCRGAAACRCRASSTRRLRTCMVRARPVCAWCMHACTVALLVAQHRRDACGGREGGGALGVSRTKAERRGRMTRGGMTRGRGERPGREAGATTHLCSCRGSPERRPKPHGRYPA